MTAGRTLWPAPFLDQRGNRRAGLPILVYVAGRGPEPDGDGTLQLADLFVDDALTVPRDQLTDPVTTDADGNETAIKAAPGVYDAYVGGETIRFAIVDPFGGGGAVASVDGQTGAVDLSSRYVAATGLTENVQDIVGGMVTGNTETGIDVSYDDTAGKLNFVVSGGVPAITVPYFDPATPQNIYHGPFWPRDFDLPPFLWRAWLRHNLGANYWISAGFGGAHPVLAGFGGGGAPTGNVYDGSGNTSFSGNYTAQDGEWLLYDVTWDGASIWVLINGIAVGRVAFSGPRRVDSIYDDLFIGGSDHSNYKGCIAQVQAWEGEMPYGSIGPWFGVGVSVERYLGTRWVDSGPACQFLANYLAPVDAYPDLGTGYDGRSHPGVSRGAYNATNLAIPTQPHPLRVADPTAPFGAQKDAARTRIPANPAAAPSGAKIWDSFGRADSIPAWSAVCSMGSTEAGSLGAKVWQNAAGNWGVFDGAAVCLSFYQFTRVTNDSADMDVRVGRLVDAARGFFYCSAVARLKADLSTGWKAYTASPTSVTLVRPDDTVAGTWTVGTTWTHLRITTAGTTVTVYTDDGFGGWTQAGQVTGETANQTEVGAGLYHYYGVGTLARYIDFEVR